VKFAKGDILLNFVVVLILALMLALILHGPNKVVRDVNQLVTNGKLYSLTNDERQALEVQLSHLTKAASINEPVRINSLYERDALNVYVTVPEVSHGIVTRGNSAFVKGRDILFIDDAHFLLGTRRIFEKPTDEAEAALFKTLRAYTVFVLAHEICHREAPRRLWGGNAQEEYEADSCAIRNLNSLYGSDQSPWTDAAVMRDEEPGAPANLASGPLYFEDLLNSLNFVATHLLDNDFPVVSGGEAHPIFFDRMQRIVDQIEKLTPVRDNASIKVARVVMQAGSNVLALHPSTVEFDNPIDYAFMGTSRIIYFDRGDSVPHAVDFKRLSPLNVLRVQNTASDAEPKIRYAWLNTDGSIGMLRTDRSLATVDPHSGQTVKTQDVSQQLGDNSCVKRAEISREPVAQVYFVYCLANSPIVRAVTNGLLGQQISLNGLARTALSKNSGFSADHDFTVFQVSLGSKGDVGVFVRQGDKVYLIECDNNLNAKQVAVLAAEPPPASDDRIGPARLNLKSWQYLEGDSSLAFSGSWLLHNMQADLVSASPTNLFAASVLNTDLGNDRMSAPIQIASYQYLNADRALVNLSEGGAFLIDLAKHEMLQISYFTQTGMEQMQANQDGYWDIHQKHGQRILVFQNKGSVP